MNHNLFALGEAGITIPGVAADLGPLLPIDAAIKSFLLLAAALIATYLLRKRAPAIVHGLWTLGFGGCLVAPLIAVVAPAWTLPILPQSLLERSRIDGVVSVAAQLGPANSITTEMGDPLSIPPSSPTPLNVRALPNDQQGAAGLAFNKSADLAPWRGASIAKTVAIAASRFSWAAAFVAGWVV